MLRIRCHVCWGQESLRTVMASTCWCATGSHPPNSPICPKSVWNCSRAAATRPSPSAVKPPWLIPQHYFDYLRGGPAEPLAAVVRHNQMDLRGLAALVGKIDALLTSADADQVESLDLFGLSRYLHRRGDSQRAHVACTQAIDQGLPKEYDAQARRELAQMAKRRGDYEQAIRLWRELTTDASAGIHACVQLAIYYERRARHLEGALEFARLALAQVRRVKTNFLDRGATARNLRLEQTILSRVTRLEHRIRISRALPALPMGEPSPKLTVDPGSSTI